MEVHHRSFSVAIFIRRKKRTHYFRLFLIILVASCCFTSVKSQPAAIAIGLILFISIFLLLSRSVIVNEKWISFLGILGLLIVFEFINLFFHPYIAGITNHSPVLMLFALVAIAALLIPLHHRLEHWIKHKMVEKNKKIRLEAARKTIEQLENKNS